jgi:hypothetical protein
LQRIYIITTNIDFKQLGAPGITTTVGRMIHHSIMGALRVSDNIALDAASRLILPKKSANRINFVHIDG